MDDDLELFQDDEGLAIVGPTAAVERFTASMGLSGAGSMHIRTPFRAGASVAHAGSEIAANSGRWVKLTEESAQKIKKYGLTPTETPGVSHAMVGQPGAIKSWVQIVTTPASMATNPAVLSGLAGIMSQRAIQQQMDEIVEYLQVVDAKLDKVLRSQTNEVLARLDGVSLAIREAMSVRDAVGRVSEVTWSKVQSSAQAINETEGYALRQLGDLADRIDEQTNIADLVDVTQNARAEAQKWLLVLARCVELHDAVAVLELDRVLDASPDELDRHRLGLKSARQSRLELMSEHTAQLLGRMSSAVDFANSKVLFNPKQSPAVVASSTEVAVAVAKFHGLLGIRSSNGMSEATRWRDAVSERVDKAVETGVHGVDGLKRFGGEALDHAGSMKDKLTARVAQRNSDEA